MNNGNRIMRFGIIGVILVILLVGLVSLGSIYENNGSGEILVIQAPFSGQLSIYTDAGMKWQGWGKCTHYKKSSQFWFSRANDQGASADQSIKVRFNEGGHANISGGVRFDLPLDETAIKDLHQTYGSQMAIEHELIRPVVEKSVYFSGPLMSSKESYAEKKADLINLIEDQAANGVFQTVPVSKEVDDPLTGVKKWITTVDLRRKDGVVLRQEESPLIRFKIKLYNLSINDLNYEDAVVKQIQTQQQATMDVQIAIANSRKAEQDALTAEKQGQAEAAKAKWAQEVVKATEVTQAGKDKEVAETQAQKRLSVANLDRQAAEQTKLKDILLGEGEATRAKLVMQANGALEQKLATYERVMEKGFIALANFKGNLVPTTVIGGSSATGNNAVNLIDLFTVKAAKDLALDMDMKAAPVK